MKRVPALSLLTVAAAACTQLAGLTDVPSPVDDAGTSGGASASGSSTSGPGSSGGSATALSDGGSPGSSGGSSTGTTSAGASSTGGSSSASSNNSSACTPGSQQCSGDSSVQICDSDAVWGSAWECATETCSVGACTGSTTAATSCPSTGGPGLNTCGAGGTGNGSCCASLEVPGGTYYRTYTNTGGGPTDEADPATVSGFRMDKYLVTVGRFRQFVTAWNNGYYPANGSGLHAHLNGGLGLAIAPNYTGQTYEQGWGAADPDAPSGWNNVAEIDPTTNNLTCASDATWTSTAGSQENLPINCVNWYEAYAFCIWDGGFLPSEAEWEYVAAGGNEQLEYPWGLAPPGMACPGAGCQYAIYNCDYPSGSGSCTGVANIAPVGTATLGAGYWGQLDMEGEVIEWNLDYWNDTYVDPCMNCAYLRTSSPLRMFRGGSFYDGAADLLPSYRFDYPPTQPPTDRYDTIGVRCARTP